MPKSSVNCPYCGSGYVNSEGNVTFTTREGKVTLMCPRCQKVFPGYWKGDLKDGELVSDSKDSPDKKPSEEKKSCFIATACFGSYSSPEVIILRDFRDTVMSKSFVGRQFVELYYKVSPPVAAFMSSKAHIRKTVRIVLLEPLVKLILLSRERLSRTD
jgi:hypothetical protein